MLKQVNKDLLIPLTKENQLILDDVFNIIWNYVPPITKSNDYEGGK